MGSLAGYRSDVRNVPPVHGKIKAQRFHPVSPEPDGLKPTVAVLDGLHLTQMNTDTHG
jgi:hypothetical protein